MSFGVIASAIVFNKRVAISYVDEVNSKIISMCDHNSFWYINKENFSTFT